MDKYQSFMLGGGRVGSNGNLPVKAFKSVQSGRQDCGEIDLENGIITVNQDDDITSAAYTGKLNFHGVNGVCVRRGKGEWEQLEKDERGGYILTLDFNDRITEVRLSFAGGLADDLILKTVYNEADKEKYYKMKALEDRKKLIANAKIDVEAHAHIFSVYFAPCREDYGSTEISLYRDGEQFLADYQSVPKIFSITVTGLGNGDYSFILRQKDKDGKLIFETDKIKFKMTNNVVNWSRGGTLPSC